MLDNTKFIINLYAALISKDGCGKSIQKEINKDLIHFFTSRNFDLSGDK